MALGSLYETLYRAVEERLRHFTTAEILWDDFNMADQQPPENAMWIRPVVNEALGLDATMGDSGTKQHEGLLTLMCFAPLGDGILSILRMVDELTHLYRNYTTNNIWFLEPMTRVVGIEPLRKTWYQINVDVPWIYLANPPTGFYEGVEQVVYTQSGHGFSVGDAIYISGANTWAKAQADAEGTLAGGVVSAINGDQFTAMNMGTLTHTHGLGSSGNVYLSTATAGALTASTAAAGFGQLLGVIYNSNTIVLNIQEGSTV
jgi:hypothetical protein